MKSLISFFQFGYFADMVYGDPGWTNKTFTIEAGLKAAEEKTAGALNAVDADLRPFKARGGKLILYHGWNDPAIPAVNSVNYYERVIAKMGHEANSFLRLYMVPGMQHCDNGPGPDSFGQVGRLTFEDPQHSVNAALIDWVEKGTAPATIIGTRYAEGDHHPTMTRPLCAYPQSAKYKGKGDTDDAANFVCEEK
jgi:Tannase and feruloyl esterase